METKEYNLTCGEVIDNLLMLADAYEKASAGKAPNGFAFNPTDAAANMKAAVHFIGSFGQQLPRWIPVAEQLPIETALEPEMDYRDVWVLACHRGEVCEAMFARTKNGDYWQVPDFGEVTPTHWMPLPEPPGTRGSGEVKG